MISETSLKDLGN